MSFKEVFAAEPDLGNRDPNNINDHLKVAFEETIGEPDSIHSLDFCWKCSYKCFNLWKALCYCIATTVCGVPHAICWGCTFACIAFVHIWQVTPYIRCIEIQMSIYKRLLTICMDAFVAPCCEACGAIFSAFKK